MTCSMLDLFDQFYDKKNKKFIMTQDEKKRKVHYFILNKGENKMVCNF